MGQDGGHRKGQEAKEQVAQYSHDRVVFADKQQPDQCQTQRCHQPAGIHAGQQPDPDRPGLQVGDKGNQVDDQHRHQQNAGYTPAIALQRERLQVAACHRADMGGDDLDHPEQGGYEQCDPGQVVTGGSAHGGGRTDVRRVIVGGPRDQLGPNAAQQLPDPVSPSYPQAYRWPLWLAV